MQVRYENVHNDELKSIYNELKHGDVLELIVSKDIEYHECVLLLVHNGFKNVVKHKGIEKGTYLIKCVKTDNTDCKKLSVIIPLYNEIKTAEELLNSLINYDWSMEHEFIIVESNSTDGTRQVAIDFANLHKDEVTLIMENKPRGKGNAVLLGIKNATGNYIAIQDGDLEYDVNDYNMLLEQLINEKTLFVLGSRYNKNDWRMRKFDGGARSVVEDYLNIGQKLLTFILNVSCGARLTDPFTMYKIFHKECMYGINFLGGNFGLDWEIVIRFLRKEIYPLEFPIKYNARSYEQGKHIELIGTPIEGIKALIHSRFMTKVYEYED